MDYPHFIGRGDNGVDVLDERERRETVTFEEWYQEAVQCDEQLAFKQWLRKAWERGWQQGYSEGRETLADVTKESEKG